MASRPARLVLLTAVALTLSGLAACDAGKDAGPDPAQAGQALATALGSGQFADVAFTDQTAQQVQAAYGKAVAGMGQARPTVDLGTVDQTGGDAATATLSWSWPVAGKRWTYDTHADLRLAGDAWQVAWSPSVVEPDLREGTVLDLTTVAARRGPIIGAGGRTLVTDRPVVTFGIDRSRVPASRAGESARRLAGLVGVDVAPYAKQVQAAGDKAFVQAIVFRRDEVPPAVARGYHAIPGAVAIPGKLPLAPTRDFAAPILGRVGPVTAEMMKEHPGAYQVGDLAGLSGLEQRYDEQLRGTPGAVVDAVAPDGRERRLFRVAPTSGKPLRITMDERLQSLAERLLAHVGPASALVAIRPSSGAILAAANGPGTNGYNIATYGQFAPGSTFKTVSSLALLRAGLTPDSTVPCTPRIVVDGKPFRNDSFYPSSALGQVPLRTAVANSCNTAFVSQAPKAGKQGLVDAAATLGMGIDHDLGFPAYFGNVQPPRSQTEAAADMIGQGTILASPMTMATVIASVQAGHTVVPRLIDGLPVHVPDGVQPLTGREDAALRTLLRGVVTSGTGLGLADVPGPPVIAKTGTAQFESNGRILTHTWMIAAQGDLAVAVLVDVGETGAQTSGPILEAFLRAARP